MATNPQRRLSRKSPSRKLKWIGLILLLFFLVALLGGVGSWLFFQHQRRYWTDKQPLLIAAPESNGLRPAEAERLYRETRQALESKRKTQLHLDNRQLQAVLTRAPEFTSWQDKLSLRLDGDKLLTQMSLPLDEIPGFRGRYLNGDFVFSLQVTRGVPSIDLQSGTIHDQPIPEKLLRRLNRIARAQLQQQLSSQLDLSSIESLKIENSNLTIELRGN